MRFVRGTGIREYTMDQGSKDQEIMDQGIFTTSLTALQHQLSNLLEGVGGAQAARLLDLLALLGEQERKAALDSFISVAEKMLAEDARYLSSQDIAEEKFVDELTKDIVEALEDEQFPVKYLQAVQGKGSSPSRTDRHRTLPHSLQLALGIVSKDELPTKLDIPINLDEFRKRKASRESDQHVSS